MKVALFFALLFALGACADDGLTEADGQGCANVAEYSCFDNVVHRCDLDNGEQTWKPVMDCSESAVENCRCTVIGSFGTCSTNSEVSGACEGTRF